MASCKMTRSHFQFHAELLARVYERTNMTMEVLEETIELFCKDYHRTNHNFDADRFKVAVMAEVCELEGVA
jgi:hypothetical protein